MNEETNSGLTRVGILDFFPRFLHSTGVGVGTCVGVSNGGRCSDGMEGNGVSCWNKSASFQHPNNAGNGRRARCSSAGLKGFIELEPQMRGCVCLFQMSLQTVF